MPTEQEQLYCASCNRNTLHQRRTANHLAHGIVTLFLCGLWIPVWFIAAMSKGNYRCQTCGLEHTGALGPGPVNQTRFETVAEERSSLPLWIFIILVAIFVAAMAWKMRNPQ